MFNAEFLSVSQIKVQSFRSCFFFALFRGASCSGFVMNIMDQLINILLPLSLTLPQAVTFSFVFFSNGVRSKLLL